MIEKTYGEAIYGYDFWSAALNESPYVLWLQKENSEEKLQLDIFNNINFGLPKVKIGVDQVIGLAGGVYSGLPTIENREFSFKTFFAGNDYKTALNAERIDYILNWFDYNKYEKMYLYWFVKDRLKTYRIEVRPSISGEQYNKYIIAKDVGISLKAEKSYFETVEETVINRELLINETIIEETIYDDWYLPSLDELRKIYVNLKSGTDEHGIIYTPVGNLLDTLYWSSSGFTSTTAIVLELLNNSWGDSLKSNTFRVRASRTFISSATYALRDIGPGNGYIYYIVDNLNGTYTYYECASADVVGTHTWSNVTDVLIGTTGTAIGTGQSNTTAIINQSGHISSAALLCLNYEIKIRNTHTVTKTTDHIISIDNHGLDTPFILEITPLESTPYLKVINDKGAGFESYYSFPANKKIVIDTATGIVTLGGTVMNSFFSSGSLFNLARGINRIYINLINCDFAIRFRERVK